MKKTVALLLGIFLLFSLTSIAYAEESPVSSIEEIETMSVGDLEELLSAIENAKNGDTITISETILIENSCTIGTSEKHISFARASDFDGRMIKIIDTEVNFVGITFDGQEKPANDILIWCENASIDYENCNFINNTTVSVVTNQGSNLSFHNCSFQNNVQIVTMWNLGTFEMRNCTVIDNHASTTCFSIPGASTISDCLFQENTMHDGGGLLMINSSSEGSITNCRFIRNDAGAGMGAAISTFGITTISNCLFYENQSSRAGNDICALEGGTVSISNTSDQLSELYSKNRLIFQGIYPDNEFLRFKDSPKDSLELPLSNYEGALCFVSEKAPEPEPDTKDKDSSSESTSSDGQENTGDKAVTETPEPEPTIPPVNSSPEESIEPETPDNSPNNKPVDSPVPPLPSDNESKDNIGGDDNISDESPSINPEANNEITTPTVPKQEQTTNILEISQITEDNSPESTIGSESEKSGIVSQNKELPEENDSSPQTEIVTDQPTPHAGIANLEKTSEEYSDMKTNQSTDITSIQESTSDSNLSLRLYLIFALIILLVGISMIYIRRKTRRK